MQRNSLLSSIAWAGVWAALLGLPAAAQEEGQTAAEQAISVPSTQRLLEIRASLPGEVKAGESFEYEVRVSNVSQNTVLRDVKIEQIRAEGLVIDSARIPDREGEAQSQRGGSWTIDELRPGQTRTIQVTAAAQKEGKLQTCLAVTSYSPAICLTTTSVKPELELVKKAPKQSNLCAPLEWEYYVKNTGSGDPGTFTINDDLPEGIQTVSGEKQLRFQVDGLKADEVRKFVAQLQATGPGNYRSAAVAIRGEGKKTRSNEAGTRIIAAALSVAIDGPQARYVNRLADYTVRVTNHGEAAAENARLTLHYPSELEMVNATQPRSSSKQVAQRQEAQQGTASSPPRRQQGKPDQRNEPAGQAEPKQAEPKQAEQKQAEQKQAEPKPAEEKQGEEKQASTFDPAETRSWKLGALKPGQTVEVGFTIRGRRAGLLQFRAVADYACGRDAQKKDVRTTDLMQTQLIALPALAVAVIDNRDPVAVGEEVQYTVIVANEGEANDSDLRVSVKLPEELKFVSASGETEVEAEGRQLQFAPVDTIRPGQKVRWDVKAKAEKKGDVRLQVEVESRHLATKTTTEEPTVLFSDGEVAAPSKPSAQPDR